MEEHTKIIFERRNLLERMGKRDSNSAPTCKLLISHVQDSVISKTISARLKTRLACPWESPSKGWSKKN